ncbi:MAG TPA: FHA domain-containing protein [Steroidobacteraceae bacterium]|nr:FHA domain-containing protein [Steroidobacteraceae bacterium]
MNVLIRQIRAGPDGIPEAQDAEAEVDVVTLGSAADRTIQLLGREVAGRHAQIGAQRSGFKIICSRGRRVRVNDREVSSAALALGDRIELGGHRLRLIAPPAGFDVAIEVQLSAALDASEFERAFRTDLAQTWLSKRGGAWLLGTLTLLAALLIPLAMISLHRHGAATPAGVPDDSLWSPGPLIPAHQHVIAARAIPAHKDIAGRACNACHEQLFVHIQDPACKQCHKSVLDHVDARDLKLTHLDAPPRCAQCHLDHDGGASLMAVRNDSLCVACHQDQHARFGSIKLAAVARFAAGGAHPAFAVTLLKPPAGAAGEGASAADQCAASDAELRASLAGWVPSREPVKSAREQSNLKFSHAQHLDPAQVTPVLGCADCHTAEPDGEHFVPVSMARSCATGGCHQLSFDARAPELPHGKPCEAMFVIEDFFARAASGDPTLVPKRRELALRLPEREQPQEPVAAPCTGPSYVCAGKRAAAEIEHQFAPKGSGCVSCHEINDTGASDIHNRFQVLPVRLTYDYFPATHFRHRDHLVQRDLTGDAACLSCHKAKESKQSSTVMIPDIGKCLECHSDRPALDKVAVQCVSCHTYHPMPIMEASRGAQLQ